MLFKYASEPVSRVLSFKTVICLGVRLPARSRHLLKYRPSKPLPSVLLRIGFTGRKRLRCVGELLPRLSTLTCKKTGGISLLHFPLRSPSAAVSRYPALRSPDFPHQTKMFQAQPSVPLAKEVYSNSPKKSNIKISYIFNYIQLNFPFLIEILKSMW